MDDPKAALARSGKPLSGFWRIACRTMNSWISCLKSHAEPNAKFSTDAAKSSQFRTGPIARWHATSLIASGGACRLLLLFLVPLAFMGMAPLNAPSATAAKPRQVVLPPLYPYQEAIYLAPQNEAGIVAATQIGKSTGLAAWIIGRRASIPNSRGLWSAPTDYQLTPGFDAIEEFGSTSGLIESVRRSKGDRFIRFINGSMQDFRSWDEPDNLLGPAADDVVADQAEELTEKADANLSSRRSATLGPMRYSGNAGIMTGPFWRVCHRLEEEAKVGAAFFQRLTWRDKAAVLGPAKRAEYEAFIAKEKIRLGPEQFGRIYEAIFLRLGSGILDFAPIAVNGGDAMAPVELPFSEPWVPSEPCIAGLDLGKEDDWTVPSVWGRHTGRLKAMDRYKTIGWQAQVARAVRFVGPYASPSLPMILYVDETGLGKVVTELVIQECAGRPITPIGIDFSNPLKAAMLQSMQVDIEQRRRSMPYIAEAVSESQTLQRKMSGLLPKYEHAEGCHDDTVWSIGMAWHGMQIAGIHGVAVGHLTEQEAADADSESAIGMLRKEF